MMIKVLTPTTSPCINADTEIGETDCVRKRKILDVELWKTS